MRVRLLILVAAVLTLCGCADHVDVKVAHATVGFWYGLWHGMVLFFSFIGSLFSDDIAIYAVYNNGGWYDCGFMIGASLALGGSSTSVRVSR